MSKLSRRKALGVIAAGGASVACSRKGAEEEGRLPPKQLNSRPQEEALLKQKASLTSSPSSAQEAVQRVFALERGRPWPTPDPFLFCVHHNDRYPHGNGEFGPAVSLQGRHLGRDFAWKDGWNMYHGRSVPGFPEHPHRGFETVTVVREGRLDHADSLGASARYGDGDVQWLTAGAGIQHAEMFPLLEDEKDNPLDLFQIWLNLPKKSKMVKPYFSMIWADQIPEQEFVDNQGRKTLVTVRAGKMADIQAPPPPPDSWASEAKNEVGIWTCRLDPGAEWILPKQGAGVNRSLYFFEGESLEVSGRALAKLQGAALSSGVEARIKNGTAVGEFLILQGRAIGEPVAKRGPFVMNTQAEIQEAYADFRATRFGGWPWPNSGPVHGRDRARFAQGVDGKIERPG